MEEDYEIVETDVGTKSGKKALVLARVDRATFLEELSSDNRTIRKADRIRREIARSLDQGTAWALASKTMKPVQGIANQRIAVYETRVGGMVVRVMTYLHDDKDRTPVFLFDFESHQGADGGIKKETKKRAERLALVAQRLMYEPD